MCESDKPLTEAECKATRFKDILSAVSNKLYQAKNDLDWDLKNSVEKAETSLGVVAIAVCEHELSMDDFNAAKLELETARTKYTEAETKSIAMQVKMHQPLFAELHSRIAIMIAQAESMPTAKVRR